jgi:putative membrane protein
MYVYRKIKTAVILSFAWKNILFFILYGTAVYFLFHWLEHIGVDASVPFAPLGTIGIAVAFYVGFKNNQSYDRFWEGRKIWGGIVNYSRTWGNQVLSYVSLRMAHEDVTEAEMKNWHKKLIYRHMAWMNALRLQLRAASTFSIDHSKNHGGKYHLGRPEEVHWKEEVGPFIQVSEIDRCKAAKNTATQLIRMQGEDLALLMEKGLIEDFRHMELMHSLEEFYNLQGMCERINNTPLPRQYAYFSTIFVWIFILILPFGLEGLFKEMGHALGWIMIPFYVIIAWIFYTMEIVGDNSEDPFENYINDVPMTALCRTIEIDLREMLGETDLPEKIQPVNGVLM